MRKTDKAWVKTRTTPPPVADSGLTLRPTDRHSGKLPAFEVEQGFKDCKYPGLHRLRNIGSAVRCPGCDRLCQVPGRSRLAAGDEIVVLKRKQVENA
ncbi:MAG: hypothetical protein AB7E47_05915 [Desulfovibrionaceae bacterium]